MLYLNRDSTTLKVASSGSAAQPSLCLTPSEHRQVAEHGATGSGQTPLAELEEILVYLLKSPVPIRAWLDRPLPVFGGSPLELLLMGRSEEVIAFARAVAEDEEI